MHNLLTPEVARVAIVLLDRVQLSGAEVPVFLQVRTAIAAFALQPEPQSQPAVPAAKTAGPTADRPLAETMEAEAADDDLPTLPRPIGGFQS